MAVVYVGGSQADPAGRRVSGFGRHGRIVQMGIVLHVELKVCSLVHRVCRDLTEPILHFDLYSELNDALGW